MAKKFRDKNDKLIKAKQAARAAMIVTNGITESILNIAGGSIAMSASGPAMASGVLSPDDFMHNDLVITSQLEERFAFKEQLYRNRAEYNEKIEKMSDAEKVAAYEKQVLIEKDYARIPKIYKKASKKYLKDKMPREEFIHTENVCKYVLQNYVTLEEAEQKILDKENEKKLAQQRKEQERKEQDRKLQEEREKQERKREKQERIREDSERRGQLRQKDKNFCAHDFKNESEFLRYLSREDFEVKLAADTRLGAKGGVLRTVVCKEPIYVSFVTSRSGWVISGDFCFLPGDVIYFDAPGHFPIGKLEDVKYLQQEKEQTEKKANLSKENIEKTVKENIEETVKEK